MFKGEAGARRAFTPELKATLSAPSRGGPSAVSRHQP
jgi:hypothetical protein